MQIELTLERFFVIGVGIWILCRMVVMAYRWITQTYNRTMTYLTEIHNNISSMNDKFDQIYEGFSKLETAIHVSQSMTFGKQIGKLLPSILPKIFGYFTNSKIQNDSSNEKQIHNAQQQTQYKLNTVQTNPFQPSAQVNPFQPSAQTNPFQSELIKTNPFTQIPEVSAPFLGCLDCKATEHNFVSMNKKTDYTDSDIQLQQFGSGINHDIPKNISSIKQRNKYIASLLTITTRIFEEYKKKFIKDGNISPSFYEFISEVYDNLKSPSVIDDNKDFEDNIESDSELSCSSIPDLEECCCDKASDNTTNKQKEGGKNDSHRKPTTITKNVITTPVNTEKKDIPKIITNQEINKDTINQEINKDTINQEIIVKEKMDKATTETN
jgi:hypothetical protein